MAARVRRSGNVSLRVGAGSVDKVVSPIAAKAQAVGGIMAVAVGIDLSAVAVCVHIPVEGAFSADSCGPVPDLASQVGWSSSVSGRINAVYADHGAVFIGNFVQVISPVAGRAPSVGIGSSALVGNRNTVAVEEHPPWRTLKANLILPVPVIATSSSHRLIVEETAAVHEAISQIATQAVSSGRIEGSALIGNGDAASSCAEDPVRGARSAGRSVPGLASSVGRS